jgi:hypothetical protein
MPEARIDQRGWFVCGEWKYNPSNDAVHFGRLDKVIAYGNWLDDLYAVLHARHMTKAYDKTYLAKVAQAMKDDPLNGGEG